MYKNGLSATKAKGYVVQFFPQKKDCFSTHQSAIDKLQQFFPGFLSWWQLTSHALNYNLP